MKHAHPSLTLLGLALTLAACGQKPAPTAAPPAAMAPAASAGGSAMSGMTPAPATAAKTGDSTGEITAIDPAGGKVTLKHEPIPGVGWPAMTMTFTATTTAPLAGLKVGDKVKFSVRIEGDKNMVTAIAKQ